MLERAKWLSRGYECEERSRFSHRLDLIPLTESRFRVHRNLSESLILAVPTGMTSKPPALSLIVIQSDSGNRFLETAEPQTPVPRQAFEPPPHPLSLWQKSERKITKTVWHLHRLCNDPMIWASRFLPHLEPYLGVVQHFDVRRHGKRKGTFRKWLKRNGKRNWVE